MLPTAPLAFTVLIFGYKAANISHQEYQHFYEQHVPLAQKLSGPWFPNSHTRYYSHLNASLAYASAPVDWDSMAVLSFSNETHAFGFSKVLGLPDNAKLIHKDEERFMVPATPGRPSPATVIVGPNVRTTTKKS